MGEKVRVGTAVAVILATVSALSAAVSDFDERMAISNAVVTNGMCWIDGRHLPIEGRWNLEGSDDCYYARLPNTLTTNVNAGVRNMRRHTSGMQFRFKTGSRKLVFEWKNSGSAMDHMPATGVSGIDIYRYDEAKGKWVYAKTGRPGKRQDGWFSVSVDFAPWTACCVNLPLYNGIDAFRLGIEEGASVKALPPRKSGVEKPVVFYGTSITHGGCASRPGMGFVNIVGRELDVPVFGLGFSGSGVMEYELSDVIARIDASCYVLDCLWNMGLAPSPTGYRYKGYVCENYERFIRNLRAKRPDVPIVMAEQCDVFCRGQTDKDRFVRDLYRKLVAEGWKNLVYLPKDAMYVGDGEGTVDGCHPNDWGMMSLAKAFGGAVREALGLK